MCKKAPKCHAWLRWKCGTWEYGSYYLLDTIADLLRWVQSLILPTNPQNLIAMGITVKDTRLIMCDDFIKLVRTIIMYYNLLNPESKTTGW